MRWFGWVLLLLMAVGWLACEIPFSRTPSAPPRQLDCWRRTPRGWEQADWLAPEIPERCPALHPGVVGLLELLVSVTALAAFSGRGPLPIAGGRKTGSSESRVHGGTRCA